MRCLSGLLPFRLALLGLLVCAALGPIARAADPGELVMERVFAYVDAEEERFQPYECAMEGHYWAHDGDGELEEEMRYWQRFIKWSADSTQVLEDGEELIFRRDDDEDDEADADGEEREQMGFDFFSAERREHYRYRFEAFEPGESARLARFELKPRKKRKDYWKGRVWVDAESGALVKADIRPAKRRFGLKALGVRVEMLDLEGMNLPERIEMDIEVKVPLIVHLKMRTELEFSGHALVAP